MNGRGRTPPGRASSRSGSAGIEFAVVIDPSSLDMQSLQAARASLHVAWAALIFSVFASGMSIVISAASLRAARAANRIAEGSLGEAKAATQLAAESLRQAAQVAERDLADWRQTKWFDLFFQAQQMCDALEYFQATYAQFASAEGSSSYWGTEPMTADFNDFLRLARRTLSMASVFFRRTQRSTDSSKPCVSAVIANRHFLERAWLNFKTRCTTFASSHCFGPKYCFRPRCYARSRRG